MSLRDNPLLALVGIGGYFVFCKILINHSLDIGANNMRTNTKQVFEYENKQDFKAKLVDWVGDVLYDILPESGYEVRDEQIFTAFQIADAFCAGKTHLAEAGLGTGKTFAYLLSAIPYARMTGKPVVIACATTALQEQLAGASGDINTLSKLLGLEIDVRMGKDPNQYVCDVRVEDHSEEIAFMSDEINDWLNTTTLGERSEMPTISDKEWKRMKWESYMPCDICSRRGYCSLVKARGEYRQTKDLLIVDHKTFFRDLWSRQERLAMGQLPILPDYSAVVLDEGHKVLLPASMQAGQRINREEMETITTSIEGLQGARDDLLLVADKIEDTIDLFFAELEAALIPGESTERMGIERNDSLLATASILRQTLDQFVLELQIEQELYTESLSPNQIQAYEGQAENAIWALDQFCKNNGTGIVAWVGKEDENFWVVPRGTSDMLNKHLFQRNIPVIFTSATLSNEGNFDYFSRTLGLNKPTTSTIGSSFDIENQVVIHLSKEKDKVSHLASLLRENGGSALVLASSSNEVKLIRKALKEYDFPFKITWEDEGERGYLVQKFREEETTVLIGSNFWEGIDVPGKALTLLIIWDLPLKVTDPLTQIQREYALNQGLDPVVRVDYPEMALRLKQGCGRLIRTKDDKGEIHILDPVIGTPWETYVIGALPVGAAVHSN